MARWGPNRAVARWGPAAWSMEPRPATNVAACGAASAGDAERGMRDMSVVVRPQQRARRCSRGGDQAAPAGRGHWDPSPPSPGPDNLGTRRWCPCPPAASASSGGGYTPPPLRRAPRPAGGWPRHQGWATQRPCY